MRALTHRPVALGAAAILTFGLVVTLGSAPARAAGPTATVCITNSDGAHVVPGTTYYKIGSTSYFANTIDGENCKYQEFPAGTTNVEIWTIYNNTSSPHLTQNITTDPVFNYQTRKLTLRLETCSAGTPLAGGVARYGPGGSYGTWFFPGQPTGANGEVAAELFPGTYSFEMGYRGTAQQHLSVAVPDADTTLVWKTTTVTIAYQGSVSYGGAVGDSTWFKQAPATASAELLPGTVRFHLRGSITTDLTYDGCAFTYDVAPPLVGVSLTGPNGGIADGDNGWFITAPVTGQVQADDTPWGASNIASFNCSGVTMSDPVGVGTAPMASEAFQVSDEGTTIVSCTATDAAGNTTPTAATRVVKIDTIKPTITAAAMTPPNANGWYNQDVVVRFTCTDDGSGIPVGNCPADETLSAEGAAVSSTAFTVTDAAGNTSDLSNVVTVGIDKTAPRLAPAVSPDPVPLGGSATVTSGASDPLSGIETEGCEELDTSSGGAKSVSCAAIDRAGNTATTEVAYHVIYGFTRFAGIANPPALNLWVAGLPLPMLFGLGGYQGSDVVNGATMQRIDCATKAAIGDPVPARLSDVVYMPRLGQYGFVWMTSRQAARRTCQTIDVTLADGTSHSAFFRFL